MNRMPPNADNMQEVLRGPFDIKLHKLTFIDYLEVVISPDGIVEYAVPSHMEKLLKIFMEQEHITDRAEAFRIVEERFWFASFQIRFPPKLDEHGGWFCNVDIFILWSFEDNGKLQDTKIQMLE